MTAAATRHSLQRQGIAKTELERQALTLDMGAPVTAALSIGGCVAAGFGDGVVRFFSPDAAPIAVAAHRGEATAEVTVAHALSKEQQQELKTALKDVTGKDVALDITEDASLLGGMIVKVGSRQIDTSLRTKLSKLKLSLKEVG